MPQCSRWQGYWTSNIKDHIPHHITSVPGILLARFARPADRVQASFSPLALRWWDEATAHNQVFQFVVFRLVEAPLVPPQAKERDQLDLLQCFCCVCPQRRILDIRSEGIDPLSHQQLKPFLYFSRACFDEPLLEIAHRLCKGLVFWRRLALDVILVGWSEGRNKALLLPARQDPNHIDGEQAEAEETHTKLHPRADASEPDLMVANILEQPEKERKANCYDEEWSFPATPGMRSSGLGGVV